MISRTVCSRQESCNDCVIPATPKPERAAENARAGDCEPCSPEQRSLVERLAGVR